MIEGQTVKLRVMKSSFKSYIIQGIAVGFKHKFLTGFVMNIIQPHIKGHPK